MSKVKQWAAFTATNAIEIALIYQLFMGAGWAKNLLIFWGIAQCLLAIIAAVGLTIAPHITDLSDPNIPANVKLIKALKLPMFIPNSLSLFVNSAILLAFAALGYWGLVALQSMTMFVVGFMQAMKNTILERLEKGDNHE